MNKLKTKERRKSARLNAYHLVKYRLLDGDGGATVASIRDISSGGACLVTEADIPKGSVIQLHINFPGFSSPVPCLAKAAWTRKISRPLRNEIGLQFLEIEDLLRKEISQRVDFVLRRSG